MSPQKKISLFLFLILALSMLSNVFTTLAFFLLFSLTVDMVGPLILALGEEIGWRGRSPSGFIIPWLIRMRVMKSDQLL